MDERKEVDWLEKLILRFISSFEKGWKKSTNSLVDELVEVVIELCTIPIRFIIALFKGALSDFAAVEGELSEGDTGSSSDGESSEPASSKKPLISVSVTHALSRDEALSRVKKLGEELKKQFAGEISGLQEQWDGYVGHLAGTARGQKATLDIHVENKSVKIEVISSMHLPGFIKSRIEKEIRKKLKEIL
jgi:hypothetical protein